MISEKERRWVERMREAGLFPKPPSVIGPPPVGAWRLTRYYDGQALIEINKVLPRSVATEIIGLCMEDEGMAEANRYHPTGNAKADVVRARTDELIRYLRTETAASGPLTQSAAASAIKDYEQAAFWAVKALTAADAVEGDERDGQSDP